jgi:uncharacterized membrane protein
VNKTFWATWRRNFLTGLAVLLPTVITLAVIKWLFGTIASLTDLLLFFLPKTLTHANDGNGDMYWYWSLAALALAVLLVAVVGLLTRYYIGKQMIAWLDATMLRVPLLNKIYGTIKQVNEAFSSGSKTSFKTVVLVEFPREGTHSLGFITSDQNETLDQMTGQKLVSVFIPTTPNPTSGFLILVPEGKLTKLDLSVAEGIKYIISLGALAPEPAPPPARKKLKES